MKKILLFAAVATFTLASFSSCRKAYNCTCEYTNINEGETRTQTFDVYNVSKDRAEQECTNNGVTTGSITYECLID